MPKPENYVCPKCNYQSTLKYRMKRHFYELKSACPDKTGVELTDEIKSHVLQHKRYTKTEASNTIHQTVNQFNVYNAIINQMDTMNKIQLLNDHQDKHLLDFEDDLEETFAYRVKRLEGNKYPAGYFLDDDDILKLIDSVTRINSDQIERFNILFDKTVKRLKYYSCGKWDTFLDELAAKEVVRLLKSYFLDTYEMYLIRNLHADKTHLNRFTVKQSLEIYYKFLVCVDLVPDVFNQTDLDILGHKINDGEYGISDLYTELFHTIRSVTKIAEKNRIKKKICEIIKDNTVHNISELNKTLLSIMRTDATFCQQLIKG